MAISCTRFSPFLTLPQILSQGIHFYQPRNILIFRIFIYNIRLEKSAINILVIYITRIDKNEMIHFINIAFVYYDIILASINS